MASNEIIISFDDKTNTVLSELTRMMEELASELKSKHLRECSEVENKLETMVNYLGIIVEYGIKKGTYVR